jgi:hypothetical protein
MHWNDRWEKLWHSIPIGAMPGEPIGLQSAVKLVIERKSGIGAAEDHSPAISFQPEFMNMWYGGRFMNMWHGGSKLQADLEERSELARAEEIRTVARDWIKEHLRTDKLRLFRDGGPPKVWVCESEFWQPVDPGDVFMQTSILDREGDKKGAYVLDRAALVELLEIGLATCESERAGPLAAAAPNGPKAEVVSNPVTPASDQQKPGPIRSEEGRRAKLKKAAREQWGDDLNKLPSREDLLTWGRDNVAANVNRSDARWLRKELAPEKITKGGAGMHRERP